MRKSPDEVAEMDYAARLAVETYWRIIADEIKDVVG